MTEVKVKKTTIKHKDGKPRKTLKLRKVTASNATKKLSRAAGKSGAW